MIHVITFRYVIDIAIGVRMVYYSAFVSPIGNIWIHSFGNFQNITFSFASLIRSWLTGDSPLELFSGFFSDKFMPRIDCIQTVLLCASDCDPLTEAFLAGIFFGDESVELDK